MRIPWLRPPRGGALLTPGPPNLVAGCAMDNHTAHEDADLVLALEEYQRAGVGNSTDWSIQRSALRMATAALERRALRIASAKLSPTPQSMRTYYGPIFKCNAAPPGWDCFRPRGHSGPCAATPTDAPNHG